QEYLKTVAVASNDHRDIIVLQTEAKRLGMYLMGQAFFSAQLMKRVHPPSVGSVALVAPDHDVVRPLVRGYEGMRVVACPPEVCPLRHRRTIGQAVEQTE